jgi:hypothetical protein
MKTLKKETNVVKTKISAAPRPYPIVPNLHQPLFSGLELPSISDKIFLLSFSLEKETC